jgi:hypothetical protein
MMLPKSLPDSSDMAATTLITIAAAITIVASVIGSFHVFCEFPFVIFHPYNGASADQPTFGPVDLWLEA